MELNIQQMIFEFLGGLGIFLFGIKFMGDGLQKSAGDKLRDTLNRYTTNPLIGVLVGIIITVLIQSSSGTTVITVGLVSAGFLTLRQAIGVIIGANIGATFTAFTIGIHISEYALPIIAIGSILIFFIKSNKTTSYGQVVFGFGALFYGLELMSDGMKPLRSIEAFIELTVNMSSHPILGVVIGTVFTVIVQSSSATIGILQGLSTENLITLNAALPVLFGDNIGATITTVLASIVASVAARRVAAFHVLFNLIGTAIFLMFLIPYSKLMAYLQAVLNLNEEMTLAVSHGIFNTTNAILQLPFISVLVWLVTRLIPGDDSLGDYKAKHLDPNFILQSPSIALGQAKEEVLRMGKFAIKGLEEACSFVTTRESKHAESAYKLESAINNLDGKITDYLVQLATSPLSRHDSEEHNILMDTVRDIERIGDHFENIIELVEYQIKNKVNVTDQAMNDLREMFSLTILTVKEALQSLDHKDLDDARHVVEKENQIDKMESMLRKQHILRLNEGKCSGSAGIVYVDIISNLERIGDHAVNIAEAVLGVRHS